MCAPAQGVLRDGTVLCRNFCSALGSAVYAEGNVTLTVTNSLFLNNTCAVCSTCMFPGRPVSASAARGGQRCSRAQSAPHFVPRWPHNQAAVCAEVSIHDNDAMHGTTCALVASAALLRSCAMRADRGTEPDGFWQLAKPGGAGIYVDGSRNGLVNLSNTAFVGNTVRARDARPHAHHSQVHIELRCHWRCEMSRLQVGAQHSKRRFATRS